MRHATRVGLITSIGVVCLALLSTAPAGTEEASPYRLVSWTQLPAGIEWGEVPGISVDKNDNVFVFQRAEPPILQFDRTGKFVKSFGDKMFVWPHGIRVDRNGFYWVTDGRVAEGKGMQVFKMSSEGRVVLTLGKAGVTGDGPDTFGGPNDVAVAANGDIFVADGHTQKTGTARIMKFDKAGKFIKEWGGHGSAPGQFEVPHSLAMDSRGRIFVADRSNNRIQIFDQDGRFLEQWTQFGGPSSLYIAADDTLYSANGFGSGPKTGSYVGSAKDGSVKAYTDLTKAECIVADSKGNIFAGETSGHIVKKLVK